MGMFQSMNHMRMNTWLIRSKNEDKATYVNEAENQQCNQISYKSSNVTLQIMPSSKSCALTDIAVSEKTQYENYICNK